MKRRCRPGSLGAARRRSARRPGARPGRRQNARQHVARRGMATQRQQAEPRVRRGVASAKASSRCTPASSRGSAVSTEVANAAPSWWRMRCVALRVCGCAMRDASASARPIASFARSSSHPSTRRGLRGQRVDELAAGAGQARVPGIGTPGREQAVVGVVAGRRDQAARAQLEQQQQQRIEREAASVRPAIRAGDATAVRCPSPTMATWPGAPRPAQAGRRRRRWRWARSRRGSRATGRPRARAEPNAATSASTASVRSGWKFARGTRETSPTSLRRPVAGCGCIVGQRLAHLPRVGEALVGVFASARSKSAASGDSARAGADRLLHAGCSAIDSASPATQGRRRRAFPSRARRRFTGPRADRPPRRAPVPAAWRCCRPRTRWR